MIRIVACALALAVGGCSSAYYSFWEKFGYEKRDILVSKVRDASKSQEAAREQFKTTMDRFKELTGFSGGELEAKYKTLSAEYETCVERAQTVSKRIASVDSVANDLFNEWEKENAQYSNPDLRRDSERKLAQTRQRYGLMLAAMRKSESKMQPVLTVFKDQVMYLKHNLNAQAIASLQGTAARVDADVNQLIKDMEASIAEANAFIGQLK